MVAKIKKWGNSLGLRIPKHIAEDAGVKEGSSVEILIDAGSLVIRPVQNKKYQLSDLLAQVRKDNLHAEISTGENVGREAW